jgi:NAD(P)-dependent dehydrogenase (short-subunit alcohol dehydrogenase family)
MINLNGHTALVTGGTQGVGAAIAISLAKAGANLILHGLEENALGLRTIAECREAGAKVSTCYVDLSSPIDEVVAKLFSKSIQVEPSIDLLVNNAGVYIDKPFLSMTESLFDRTFHINVKVGYFITQAFATYWQSKRIAGRVLFTGSINGMLAESDHSSYDASKAAVAGLVRSLCVALAPMGIRVNSMAPGLVRTPLTDSVLATDPEALKWMQLHTPNCDVPPATVCGPTAAFLLSDAASHIHGQTIYVDGGMSAWQQPDLPMQMREHLRGEPSS